MEINAAKTGEESFVLEILRTAGLKWWEELEPMKSCNQMEVLNRV